MNELYETNRRMKDEEFINLTSESRIKCVRLKEPSKLGEEFVYAMSNFEESDKRLWINFMSSVRDNQPEFWQAVEQISPPILYKRKKIWKNDT